MKPQLLACWFPASKADTTWRTMARVLDYSARTNSTGWDVRVVELAREHVNIVSAAYATNTQKLDYWTGVVLNLPNGTRIVLMDVDTMILQPLDPVWAEDFDIAITEREARPATYPYNAGVIFLRVSDPVKRFMERWRDENRRMVTDSAHHRRWRAKYGGINQAALGALLEGDLPGELGIRVAKLKCAEWNCEDSAWSLYHPERTRVVHLKSGLRRSIFGVGVAARELRGLAGVWRRLEMASRLEGRMPGERTA